MYVFQISNKSLTFFIFFFLSFFYRFSQRYYLPQVWEISTYLYTRITMKTILIDKIECILSLCYFYKILYPLLNTKNNSLKSLRYGPIKIGRSIKYNDYRIYFWISQIINFFIGEYIDQSMNAFASHRTTQQI